MKRPIYTALLLWVSVWLALLAPPPVPGRTADAHDNSSSNKNANATSDKARADTALPAPKKPSAPTPTISGQNDAETIKNGKIYTVKIADPITVKGDKNGWDIAAVIATFLLVAVGVGGVIVATLTMREIGRQATETARAADGAKASADATRKNVDVLIEAQRAWIVESIKFADRIPRQSEMSGGILHVAFLLKNIGKQPARIRNIQTRFHTSCELLPAKPHYGERTFLPSPEIGEHGRLLAPDEPFWVSSLLEEGSLDDDQIDHIQGKKRPDLALYAYGCIHYETMGLPKRNQFCYVWHNLMGFSFKGDKEEFRRGGPAEYNKHD